MRRQDRRDPQRGGRRRDLVVRRAGGGQPGGRRREGVVGAIRPAKRAPPMGRAPGSRPVALRPPGGSHELALLGEIDEPEVEAERSDDDLGAVRIEPGELRHETRPERRVVASSEADRRPPDALDEVEQVPSGLLRDDLAEKRPE